MLWLVLISCADWPDGPPPAPSAPSSVDTMDEGPSEAPVAEAAPGGPNRPPAIRDLTFTPEDPTSQDDLRVRFESKDPDGDMVSSAVRWFVNGEPVPGESRDSLRHAFFKKGDRVTVEIEVNDGRATATERPPEVVIGNAPPRLLSSPRDLRGGLDGLQIRAEDPDGDRLTYSVEGGPAGLTIDTAGVLHFQGSASDAGAGRFNAQVKIADSSGEFVALPVSLDLSAGREDERRMRGQ
ncbi:Ig domain-containing protein [Myxococcota bacterium]|nr:Ig domain-containing protein [Myxococcota bacterium]